MGSIAKKAIKQFFCNLSNFHIFVSHLKILNVKVQAICLSLKVAEFCVRHKPCFIQYYHLKTVYGSSIISHIRVFFLTPFL